MRWSSEGAGDFEVETITRPERGTSVILHLREGEEEFLSGWKLKSIISKYSDHISLPILMQKEEWDAEAKKQVTKDEWAPVNKAAALWTRPKSEITQGAVRGVLQADQLRHRGAARLHAQPRRGPQRVHAAALHPGEGAVRPVEPRQARRRQALRQARLHHGRRRGADAGVPALRQGRDRLERPAAQRQSRELLQESRDVKAIREGSTKRVLSMLEGAGRERGRGREGEVRRVLEGLRRRPQGRHRRGLRQPRAPDQAATASRSTARRRRRARACRCPST